MLSSSVRLGPWIHVSTRAHHRGIVRDGELVEVRGVVTDEREHKGHRFVDLDVEITADGRPVVERLAHRDLATPPGPGLNVPTDRPTRALAAVALRPRRVRRQRACGRAVTTCGPGDVGG